MSDPLFDDSINYQEAIKLIHGAYRKLKVAQAYIELSIDKDEPLKYYAFRARGHIQIPTTLLVEAINYQAGVREEFKSLKITEPPMFDFRTV